MGMEAPPTVFAQRSVPALHVLPPYGGSVGDVGELLHTKHASSPQELYPNHGFARGGVGHLVSTGVAACRRHAS